MNLIEPREKYVTGLGNVPPGVANPNSDVHERVFFPVGKFMRALDSMIPIILEIDFKYWSVPVFPPVVINGTGEAASYNGKHRVD